MGWVVWVFPFPPPPRLLLFQPNTHSLGHLFISPQASSKFETKMVFTWSKCAWLLAKICLHCRLAVESIFNCMMPISRVVHCTQKGMVSTCTSQVCEMSMKFDCSFWTILWCTICICRCLALREHVIDCPFSSDFFCKYINLKWFYS